MSLRRQLERVRVFSLPVNISRKTVECSKKESKGYLPKYANKIIIYLA